MQNPFLGSQKSILAYMAAWSLAALFHTLLVTLATKQPVGIILTEGIIICLLFSVIGLGLWFPVFYGRPEYEKPFHFFLRHLFAGCITVTIWISIHYLVMFSLFGTNASYMAYLHRSIIWKAGIGALYYSLTILVYYLMIYIRNMNKSLIKEAELKTLVRESELNSLKAQINPHFLFNALNSVSSLTIVHPEKAQEMIIKLSDFLRYSISNKEEKLTSLRNELENVNRYLDIEKVRFGKRLIVRQWIGESCLDMKLPGLILQPLVENAVKYSIYENTGASVLEIECKTQQNLLIIIIRNDFDPGLPQKKGEGMGLQNIRNRLHIQYDRDDLLGIRKDGNTFEVTIVFPQSL